MKKILRLIMVLTLAFTMAATYAVPASVFAFDTQNPKAANVQYIMKDGKKDAIKSFDIAPYTYYNLSQDSKINPGGSSTIVLNDAKLRDIAVTQIFPRWSIVAENIFRDQASQLVSMADNTMCNSSKTSRNAFDTQFNYGKKGVSEVFKNEGWAVEDFAYELSRDKANHKGKFMWDEVRATGVTAINGPADARTLMGQELRNCSDDNDVSVDDFLGNDKQETDNKYRLPDLKKAKGGGGFASVLTCVNRQGSSGDYDYATFGIAVYDFDITPIAANDLKIVEAADKVENGADILMGKAGNIELSGIKFAENDRAATHSYLRNATSEESVQSSSLKNGVTETVKVSNQESFQFSSSQSIGLNVNLGTLTNSTMPRATITTNFTFGEMWGSVKGEEKSHSTADDKSLNTTVTLPGYTVAKVTQNVKDKKTVEEYQQPVVLNYKVAIYAMSGDYYNGVTGGINPSRYDKQWMSVLFDGSDVKETCGNDALGSLYNRAVINKDTQGYDKAYGKYKSWCDKSAWNGSDKINWSNVASELTDENETRTSHNITSVKTGKKSTIENIASELPLIESASTLESKQVNMTSSVDQIVALHPLASVVLKKDSKQLMVHPTQTFHLDGLELGGLNQQGGEFYGFNDNWGEWKLYDEANHAVIEDGSAQDGDTAIGKIKVGKFTLVNDSALGTQSVEVAGDAADGETAALKWMVDLSDNTKIVSNDDLISGNQQPYMSAADRESITTPNIRLNVVDGSSDAASVEISGAYSGKYKEKINLGHKLSAYVLDTTGKAAGFPIYWEDRGTEAGITVSANGDTEFSRPGRYKVRAYTYNRQFKKVYSDWVEIKAKDSEELSEIKLVKPEFDEDELHIEKKYPSRTFNLASWVEYTDQYGDRYDAYYDESKPEGQKWVKREVPELEFTVDDDENAYVDNGVLTVFAPGNYKISARAYRTKADGSREYLNNFNINNVKIRLTGEDWISFASLEQPDMSIRDLELQDKDDVIAIRNLSSLVKFYDQSFETWEGKKPNVSFAVNAKSNSAEIKGDTLFIYNTGNYTLSAFSNSFDIEPIDIMVTENRKLVIKTEDPGILKLTKKNAETSINIENCVDFTTQFGGSWKADTPKLSFTLDQGVDGAKLERKRDLDESTGKLSDEYIAFTASKPGEYRVHVAPEKAGEYSEPIDDIIVRVEEYLMVDNVAIDVTGNIRGGDLDDLHPMLNSYEGIDSVSYSLKDRVIYRSGEEVLYPVQDPKKDKVILPDVSFSFYENEEKGISAPSSDEAVIKDGVLTAKKPGEYWVCVDSPSDDVTGSFSPVFINDITWEHDFGSWVLQPADPSQPECLQDMIAVKSCQGHVIDDSGTTEACDYRITKTIPASGHKWEKQMFTFPYPYNSIKYYSYDSENGTYTENPGGGWVRYDIKCSKCNEVRESVYLPWRTIGYRRDNNHATCTEDGKTTLSELNSPHPETFEVTVPATGHHYVYDSTVYDNDSTGRVVISPTCENEGLDCIVLKCSNCDAEIRDEITIPKLHHIASGDQSGEAYVVPATCTEDGYSYRTCENCNEEFIDDILPATGHEWGEWETVRAATTEEPGIMKRTCSVCSEEEEAETPVIVPDKDDEGTIPDKDNDGTLPDKDGDGTVPDKDNDGSASDKNNDGSETPVTAPDKNDGGSGTAETVVYVTDLKPVKGFKAAKGSRKITVKWKKAKKNVLKTYKGYEIQCSTKKTFDDPITRYAGRSAKKKQIKKLKKKRNYYVRMRAYRRDGNVIHVSKWTKVKKVRVK